MPLATTPTPTSTPTLTPTATPETVQANYLYDGDGNLARGIVNGVVTFYPGRHYNREVDGANVTVKKFYTLGSSTVAVRTVQGSNDTLNWILSDHLGSASVTANADGTWNSEIKYTAFGEVRASYGLTPTDYRYTGQLEQASINLYWMGSRWHDPALGRWIQPDPIIPDLGNPLAWDRYSYVYNNPVRYIDPSGNTPWDVVDVVFFLLSAYDFAQNPTWGNAGWLLLDTASLAPVIPSVGSYIRRGAQAAGLYDEVTQFAAKYGDNIYEFAKVAHKRGATTLLEKFLKATTPRALKGAEFELEFALKNSEDIVEIGRKLPENSEIDFVMKGDIFVNVKNYNWSDPFFSKQIGSTTGLDIEIMKMVSQAKGYLPYSNGVKYVFNGSVPDKVRTALEAAGIIVEVIP